MIWIVEFFIDKLVYTKGKNRIYVLKHKTKRERGYIGLPYLKMGEPSHYQEKLERLIPFEPNSLNKPFLFVFQWLGCSRKRKNPNQSFIPEQDLLLTRVRVPSRHPLNQKIQTQLTLKSLILYRKERKAPLFKFFLLKEGKEFRKKLKKNLKSPKANGIFTVDYYEEIHGDPFIWLEGPQ